MDALRDYFQLLSSFDNSVSVAIDRSHDLLLFGTLVSRKPERVLELGIGSGFVSWTIVYGLRYNGKGTLTCVDNWLDWEGERGGRGGGGRKGKTAGVGGESLTEPKIAGELRRAGVKVIAPVTEEQFVKSSPSSEYDFLVSDADHRRSGSWIDEHLRITKHDGFMFFHDTNHKDRFRGLRAIEQRISELHLPHYHFTASSRADERCERGWLFAINKKDPETPERSRDKRASWKRIAGGLFRSSSR